MFKKYFSLSSLTLLVALAISSIAAYYSIIGLTAIFAGAVIPVIIMGSILEVGKITTTVWLRKYWHRASWLIKLYLVPAVVALALLTSMGIFGFLSKAHMEQGVTSGDAQSKVAIYDEKIKTSKDNIDANRKALKQLDEAVDQVMGRSTTETGADKAVSIRRGQQKERARLLDEIQTEQKNISKLSEERAPLASELRKVEAEVGPIKYIAALIYGDNADQNMLEAAVRWVIILLVAVFDPLAIALVLAANASKEWDNEETSTAVYTYENTEKPSQEEVAEYEADDGPLTDDQLQQIKTSAMRFNDPGEHPKDHDQTSEESIVEEKPFELPEPDIIKREPEKSIFELHPYLKAGFAHFDDIKPMVYHPEDTEKETIHATKKIVPRMTARKKKVVENVNAPGLDASNERPGDYLVTEIQTENVTELRENPVKEVEEGGDYVTFNGGHFTKKALKSMKPELFSAKANELYAPKNDFGTTFPAVSNKGDVFVRVDVLPNRVYKFDGKRWIETNKDQSDTYLDDRYTQYLIEKLGKGEYDPDLLTDYERTQIEENLNKNT